MVVNLVQINWENHLLKAGWAIPDSYKSKSNGSYLFWKTKLYRVPKDLWDPSIETRFAKLINNSEFQSWWIQINGGRDKPKRDNYFCLNFPAGKWNIPWELLVSELDDAENQERILISRTSGKPLLKYPSIVADKLRILVLQGASDGDNLDPLDLDHEYEIIIKALNKLNVSAKECVDTPICVPAILENISKTVNKYRPHIIWFTGHGDNKLDVRLWFANNTWVTGKQFAGELSKSNHIPTYIVFSACNTAKAGKKTYINAENSGKLVS